MLFSYISWVMLMLTLLVALPGALASPSPKRAKKSTSSRVTPETYSALENGELATPNRRVQTLGDPAPVSAPLSAPAAYVVNSNPKFETVPSEKRAQILQRMRICQSLFEVSGRAYDYRSMTTAELQKELDAVRGGERPIAAKNPEAAAKPVEHDPILDAQE